ncbi:MAG: M1 family metallopeptidase [Bacteroidota bacterium]
MQTKSHALLSLAFMIPLLLSAQQPAIYDYKGDIYEGRGPFTAADTLRGSLNPMRQFDVIKYDLTVQVHPHDRSIVGRCVWTAIAENALAEVQVDLMSEYMNIDKIALQQAPGVALPVRRLSENAVAVRLPQTYDAGERFQLIIDYQGTPRVAPNAPWDGGFSWQYDENNKPWIGVSCEGFGASSWWPLKDHLSDEPDSGMTMTYIVPDTLVAVGNGRLVNADAELPTDERFTTDGYTAYQWQVENPINSYNVSLYIGDYVKIDDQFAGEEGTLDLQYWVLSGNERQASQHFKQVKPMLKCFEQVFAPYAFYEDSYKLVETSYWGMEHQSAIAYGNQYRNNEWGWDYIIVHESGHEWFGNNISTEDHAELWIHESFTTYSEALLVECLLDFRTMEKYLESQRFRIRNADAILGPRGVNFNDWASSDMYFKGSWMLHTLRKIYRLQGEQGEKGEKNRKNRMPKNDSHFKQMLHDMNVHFRKQTLNSDDLIGYINDYLGKDYTPFFAQYLAYKDLPVLQWRVEQFVPGDYYDLSYRLKADVKALQMPVYIKTNTSGTHILPDASKTWRTARIKIDGETKVAPTKLEDDTFLIEFDHVSSEDN